jgi:hypothetical protein
LTGAIVREILQVVYNWFREHGGEWPSFGYIQWWLNRYGKPGAVDTLSKMPDKLRKSLICTDDRRGPDDRIVLSIVGVARCRASSDDVHNFIEALQWMVEQDRNKDPGTQGVGRPILITTEQLAEALNLPLGADPNSIRRLVALLRAEGLVSSDDGS